MRLPFHPWHHIANENTDSGILRCIVEIPKGSKVKYELDKETGLLKLDRVLYSSVHYPVNYGFIPQTLDYDGDPLDILVICQERIEPLCLVEAKVIGIMHMIDSGDNDDKIIAVANKDIGVNYINSIDQLPPHTTVELKKFFEDYKVLENKKTEIEKFESREKALDVIRHSQQRYKELVKY